MIVSWSEIFSVVQVSAGFDAHWRDPLAGLQFRTSTFHYLAAQVKQLANAIAGELSKPCCMTVGILIKHKCIMACVAAAAAIAVQTMIIEWQAKMGGWF